MSALRELETRFYDKINPAVHFSVSRYVLSIGLFLAAVVFGLISALGLGVDLLPAVNLPSVSVSVSYPGAGPEVIDQQVVQVLENAVSTLAGITDINSQSSSGSGRVSVSFDAGYDKDTVTNQVASLVAAAVRRLPSGASAPSVRSFDPNAQPILEFGLSGGGASLAELASWADESLVPLLERVPGVAAVNLDGAPERQLQVLLDPNRMGSYNLSPQQVVSAIAAAAVNQPIGSLSLGARSVSFATRSLPEGIEAVRRVLVDPARGISVAELATVREVLASSSFARVNGQPVVLVSIQRTADSNSVAVADGVKALIGAATLPPGYSAVFSNDTTGPIRASMSSAYRELVTSLIVVALIVLLFLGKPDTSLSVILAIPIALAAAPVLYRLMGFSFNLVSLLAMVVAIGIVVDDSIVVAENVERYRDAGFPAREAVLRGASEVFTAVVASTLTLLAVLVPVSFVGGYIGRYLMQFSLGLAAAVAFSLLESLFFLTVRLSFASSFRLPAALTRASDLLTRRTERAVNAVRDAYAASLGAVLPRSGLVLALSALALAGTAIFVIPRVPFSFVPQNDGGSMGVSLRFPQGTSQDLVNAMAGEAEALLMARPEIATVQTSIGGGAFMNLSLVAKERRPSVFLLAPEYRRLLQPVLAPVTGARLSVSTGGFGGGFGGGASLQFSLVSPDFRLLADRADAIIAAVQEDPLVADASTNLGTASLERNFRPDPTKLEGTGLSPQGIAQVLQVYASGAQAASVVSAGSSYPIRVRLDPDFLSGGQSLLDLPIYSPALQSSLSIGQLGSLAVETAPSSLQRYNRQYAGQVTVNLLPGAPPAAEMQGRLEGILIERGLVDGKVSLASGGRTGQAALARELGSQGPKIYLLALFLSYLVMAAQFNSWRYPIYLLIPVPLALVGGFLVVWIFGGGLDIFGVMGMIMLIGLSSKTAILYLEFVEERLGTMAFETALVEAGRLRFRPIAMTTLTTLVIAFPLILSGGQGAEFGQRMGIVMFGGIVVSALLTLYVVPAAFYLFERKRALAVFSGAAEAGTGGLTDGRHASGEGGRGEAGQAGQAGQAGAEASEREASALPAAPLILKNDAEEAV